MLKLGKQEENLGHLDGFTGRDRLKGSNIGGVVLMLLSQMEHATNDSGGADTLSARNRPTALASATPHTTLIDLCAWRT